MYYLLKTILKKENYQLNFDELKLQLLSHPSYPSLHAITGVLDHFSIDNLALEVPQDMETFKQLPNIFISFFENEFVIISKEKDTIEVLHDNKERKTISINKFLDAWNGIIVVIEKEDTETTYNTVNNKALFNTLFAIVTILVISLFFFSNPSFFEATHFILSLAGIGISFLIVKHELGFQSEVVDKFCSSNDLTSCDAVLNSKGASISKHFKLSDISFIYFIGLALAWILSIFTASSNTNIFVLLSLIALPVIFYSVYYQLQIVKKWCPLCLGIASVLWVQCCSLFLADIPFASIKPDINSSFILFFSFIFIAALWLFIKPLLEKQQALEKLEITHYKFKRNFDLFNAVFSKNDWLETSISDAKEIVLGNKNAALNILVVTSPACFYCRSAHEDLEKILNKNFDNIRVTIRFNVPEDKKNIAFQVGSRLLEIYNNESVEICSKALHEAYKDDVNLNTWLSIWGKVDNNIYENILDKQKKWCHKNNINFTPALFVNGRQFPKEYERSDINYFIDDLIELTQADSPQPETIEALV